MQVLELSHFELQCIGEGDGDEPNATRGGASYTGITETFYTQTARGEKLEEGQR